MPEVSVNESLPHEHHCIMKPNHSDPKIFNTGGADATPYVRPEWRFSRPA